MYALGVSLAQRSCRFPSRPTMGNRGRKLVSKPVAQTMASTRRTSPDSSSMPSGTNRRISDLLTSTLGCVRARRYPWPGVILLAPSGKSGISALQSASLPLSIAVMYSVTLARAKACAGLFART